MTDQRKGNIKANPTGSAYVRFTWIIGTALIAISIILSILYLFSAWNKYKNAASSEAVALAQSLETFLQPEHIAELSGGMEDLETPEYIVIKRNLMRLVETTNDIDFAYLMGMKGGNIIFLLDSESPDSPGYSPPGQVYTEADENTWGVFSTGKTVLSGPKTDRWGTWISVLVPVKDVASGQVIAAFGLDFSASEWRLGLWKQMIHDICIALLIVLFVIALSRAGYHYFKLNALSKKIALDEALYHSVFDQAPVGIAIVNDKNFVSKSKFGYENINPMFEKILGRTRQELSNISWPDITHPEDLQVDLEQFEKFKAGEIDDYTLQKRFLKSDGSYVWTYMKITHFLDDFREYPLHLCLLLDISTERKIADSLSESERSKAVLLSNLPGMAYRCSYDRDWTMQFVSAGCYNLTGYASDSLINNKDLAFNEIVAPEYREIVWIELGKAIDGKQQFKLEYEIITASGKRKWVIEIGKCILSEKGEVEALEGIILDISDRKEMERKLIYSNEHDSLTGLYNRSYLDKLLIKDHKNHIPGKRALIGINLSTIQALSITYGFNYTQELIKKIAFALNQHSSENRILAKTGENRFVFYMKNYMKTDELINFSRKIAETLRSILAIERVGGGIGIVEIIPDEELDLQTLSKNLTISSKKAIDISDKGIGIYLFDKIIEMQMEREQGIERELEDIAACEEGSGLYLQYQPILDLKTNMICGFEALARLETKELGKVPPLEFIPIAEKTKLIAPIGWEITRQAFQFLNKLKSSGYEKTYVAINFSVIQIMERNFVHSLCKMITEMQVKPESICIEITESVFTLGYDDINVIMSQLRDY